MQTNGTEAGVTLADLPERTLRTKITDLYLDMDGIIVDFVAGALKAHGAKASALVPGEWYIENCLGINAEVFWSKCQGHLFWEELPWMIDGQEILKEAEAFASAIGANFWLLSTPSDDIGCFSGKYEWLRKHIPRLRRRLILACSKNPVSHPGGLLIDDSDANFDGWEGTMSRPGGQAILVPRIWNSQHTLAGQSNSMSLVWLRRRLAAMRPAA